MSMGKANILPNLLQFIFKLNVDTVIKEDSNAGAGRTRSYILWTQLNYNTSIYTVPVAISE